jgi:hypothetical protein
MPSLYSTHFKTQYRRTRSTHLVEDLLRLRPVLLESFGHRFGLRVETLRQEFLCVYLAQALLALLLRQLRGLCVYVRV